VKGLIASCLFLFLTLPAIAAESEYVKYVGGTAQGLNVGTVGRLDTTGETSLAFQRAGNNLTIPYSAIESSEYSKDVARHLGVLPAIVVALVRMRQHRHFFRITYHDQNGVAQVAIFEVPKHMPRTLQAVLEARAPHTFKSCLCVKE